MTALPPFTLHRPRSIEEAAALMTRYGDTAAVYCGGTELLLAMKLGYAQYDHLIRVRDIPELHGVRAENGTLRIGATTTHREIEQSPEVRRYWPAMAEMTRRVANVRVRSTGTLGGNLCFADPHSDPATFLLVANAELVCGYNETSRTVPLDAFLLGPYQTALRNGELLTEIRVPSLPPRAVVVHKKLSFRERPAATITCLVRVKDGAVAEARLAVGSVGVLPVRVHEGEALLAGLSSTSPASEQVQAAAEAAAVAAQAVEDANGSPDYKENLVRVLVRRAFEEALARVRAR